MKENLSIQFVYPNSPMPKTTESIIESIDHIKIVPESIDDDTILASADIIVTDSFDLSGKLTDKIYVVRIDYATLLNSVDNLKRLIKRSRRVNVVLSNTAEFQKEYIEPYRSFLNVMADFITDEYLHGNNLQFNLITDRMMLSEMNNCNAGDESITVSPDGLFYPCPAFIGNKQFLCGNIVDGFQAPNIQLYRKENAPICKICDAYHCKRCVWLNNLLTHEINTPSWQQCYMAHLEREASKKAIESIRSKIPNFLSGISISDLEYLDPYTKIESL